MVNEETHEITCAYCKRTIQEDGLVVDSLELGYGVYCDDHCLADALDAETMTHKEILKKFGIEEEDGKEDEDKEDYFGLGTWRDAIHNANAKVVTSK